LIVSKRIIIGLGTGRCGTRSLSRLLSAQPEVYVSHELPPGLPWTVDQEAFHRQLALIVKRDRPVVGDIAFYWLPYATLVLSTCSDSGILCLRRDREETIRSFMRWCANNHRWLKHDGRRWKLDGWDRCYPKYDIEDRVNACGRYWDEYYSAVEGLQAAFPDRVQLRDMNEALNTKEGVSSVLSFAGVPADQQVLRIGVHEHRGKP
jgi:hypothetical protein